MRQLKVTCDECGAPAESGFQLKLRRTTFGAMYAPESGDLTRDFCETCGEILVQKLLLPRNMSGEEGPVRHEQNINMTPEGFRAYCSCGWMDSEVHATSVRASEAAQDHAEEQHPREKSDVENYGAGAS